MEFKNFNKAVEEYCSFNNNEAIRKVLTSLTEDEVLDTCRYGCSSGCASPFIYRYQTKEFFESHYEEVLENLDEMKNFCFDDFFYNLNFNFNDLVWLYVEQVVSDFISYCKCEGLTK